MIKEYETTVSKIIYYDKNKKTNFWRMSVKCHLWVPLTVVRDNTKTFTSVGLSCKYVILFSKETLRVRCSYVISHNITC